MTAFNTSTFDRRTQNQFRFHSSHGSHRQTYADVCDTHATVSSRDYNESGKNQRKETKCANNYALATYVILPLLFHFVCRAIHVLIGFSGPSAPVSFEYYTHEPLPHLRV